MSDAQRRFSGEVAELTSVNENLTRTAGEQNRDLTTGEMDIINRNNERMGELQQQIDTVAAAQRARSQSLESLAMLGAPSDTAQQPADYQRAGEWVSDFWRAGAGIPDAQQRIARYMSRVAAHVTTADNPGLVPPPVLGPLLKWIDEARPLVSMLGPRPIPGGPTFYRPQIKTPTKVGKQTAEKTELVSQKLETELLSVAVETYGGYVNVSRQLIDWSSPDALQIIIDDLASQYAVTTEAAVVTKVVAAGTAGGGTIGAGADGEAIAAALWGAAAKVYAGTKGAGRVFLLCGPDNLGALGAAFAAYNPQNAQGSGFMAGSFGSGVQGTISGIPVVVSPAVTAGTAVLMSTAAAEVYEQRLGTLQVTEPSVLGVQVAYAGYFASVVLRAAGVQKITVT